MPYVTLTVAPDQDLTSAVRVEHKRSPSLAFLQAAVGGYIELVPHLTSIDYAGRRVRCTVYCNEEGRLKGTCLNVAMSSLWRDELLRCNSREYFVYEPEIAGSVIFVVNANQLKSR